MDREGIIGHWPRYATYTKVIFRGCSLIPETSAHFNQLFETSSNPRMTARVSKQTMQNIIMETVEFCLDNTKQKFADLSGNQLAIDFKRLFVLKFTYPSARLGVFLSVPLFSVAFSQLLLKSCGVNEATKQQCTFLWYCFIMLLPCKQWEDRRASACRVLCCTRWF